MSLALAVRYSTLDRVLLAVLFLAALLAIPAEPALRPIECLTFRHKSPHHNQPEANH